jgi:hypothetical protein
LSQVPLRPWEAADIFISAVIPFKGLPIVSLAKAILMELKGTPDKNGLAGSERELLLELKKLENLPSTTEWKEKIVGEQACKPTLAMACTYADYRPSKWASRAPSAFNNVARRFFASRKSLCHSRGLEELADNALIHDTIRQLDVNHGLGIFEADDFSDELLSPAGIDDISSLESLQTATRANLVEVQKGKLRHQADPPLISSYGVLPETAATSPSRFPGVYGARPALGK